MSRELSRLLHAHLSAPFPDSVAKGEEYGLVEPVMIDAAIYGWASGGPIDVVERARFRQATDDLADSLTHFPREARLYFTRLLLVAEVALATLDANAETAT